MMHDWFMVLMSIVLALECDPPPQNMTHYTIPALLQSVPYNSSVSDHYSEALVILEVL